jgi:hypothetical protein
VTSALVRLSADLARACPAAGEFNTRSAAAPQPAALHAGAALFYREAAGDIRR